MKKILIVSLLLLIGLYLAVCLLVPLFVSSNKLMTSIQARTHPYINADLRVGQAKLSLWTGIYLSMEDVSLVDQDEGGNEILWVEDVYVGVPYASFWNPQFTVLVEQAEVRIAELDAGEPSVLDLSLTSLLHHERGIEGPIEFSIEHHAKLMDLDAVLPPSGPGQKADKTQPPAPSEKEGEPKPPSPPRPLTVQLDVDATLAKWMQHESVASMSGTVDSTIDVLRVKSLEVKGLKTKLEMVDQKVTISQEIEDVFDGTAQLDASAQLSSDKMPFEGSWRFTKTDLTRLLSIVAQRSDGIAPDAAQGDLTWHVDFDGKGFDRLMETTTFSGSLLGENVVVKALDLKKLLADHTDSLVAGMGSDILGLEEKLPAGPMQYQQVSSPFTLQQAVMQLPEIVAIPKSKEGLYLEGAAEANLRTQVLNAIFRLTDVDNITRLDEVSVTLGGKKVERVLIDGDQPFQIPIHIGCYLTQPCFQYEKTLGYLRDVALENIAGQGEETLEKQKKELGDKAGDLLKDLGL